MKKLFSIPLLVLLVGCTSLAQTPAQKVFQASSIYDAALSAAVAYKQLPPCGQPASPALCSDKASVATLQKADNVAFEALSSGQKVVRDPKATASARDLAVAWATEAAAAFNRISGQLKK